MRCISFWLLLCLGLLCLGTIGQAAEDRGSVTPEQLDFFETRIRPVLAEHCYSCHSAKSQAVKGGLLLDSRRGIRTGGDSGAAVVPHRPDASLLLDALNYESYEMPPQGKLPDRVIADFERWIRDGAADPRKAGDPREAGPAVAAKPAGADIESGREFWSFQPIGTPDPPAVRDSSWPSSDIDRFVLARLEAAGLVPNHDAAPRTLIRRLYFDLHGLPPSPSQVQAFLEADQGVAWEALVDQLLESPRFGERWGRHWLDVVRYAESTGGGRTKILRNAWRYRDYVVEAFNQDRPIDQFLKEQIAGDLLPWETPEQRARQLTATSFLGLGPINYELQDKTLLTMEIVDEQLDTIGRSMLGMTIGCARCHDHKFDPIPTRDYYALAGFFRNTKTVEHANVSNLILRPLPVAPAWQAKLDEHATAKASIESALRAARSEHERLAKQLGVTDVSLASLPGIVVDDVQAKAIGRWSESTSIRGFLGPRYLFAKGSPAGDHRLVFTSADLVPGEYEVRVSYTSSGNRAANALIAVAHRSGQTLRRIDQRRRPAIDGRFVTLGRFHSGQEMPLSVTISNRDANGVVIGDVVQFLPVGDTVAKLDRPGEPKEDAAAVAERRALQEALDRQQAVVDDLEGQLKKLDRRAPPAAPVVISVQDQEEVEDCPLHIRGSVKNLGEPIPRGFLQVASFGEPPASMPEGSGRIALADWIASPANPLTARVFVNRVWLHLMDRGIVGTPDNFGTVGELPTHPELLDHLASEFIRDGWSVKRLIKRIVLARVYRLSSEHQEAGATLDPENLLRWRATRKRLEAEAIRDAILAVSGQLDFEQGGSLIAPSVKSEFGYRFTSLRRSVYVPVFRNTLHDLFEVFDFSNPNLVTGQRSTGTLPTQALYLMNSPFVIEQATHAARSLLDTPGDDALRVRLAYERSLGRLPSATEQRLALEYVWLAEDASSDLRVQRWARFQQALFGCLDFRYVK